MEQTYYCNYPLEYYAKESAQSIPSFIRNFKNETGVSPKKYLNSLKIEKAKMFLSTTNLSVTTIALNLGMDDPFYFCNFRLICATERRMVSSFAQSCSTCFSA